jgi:hypothetical protein
MIVLITRRADDVFGGTGGSSRGFRTWGSFPQQDIDDIRDFKGVTGNTGDECTRSGRGKETIL